jgi:protoporphyrinogen oxidase
VDVDAAVLGAGPAGLAAAHRLASTGRSVVVLERSGRVGGLAGSFEVAGVRVDHGSHRLHPATAPDVMALLRSLLRDDLQRRPRHGRIRLAGRWVAFPPRAGDLVRTLPPRFALGLARDALTSPLRRARADTFAEVVRAGLGPTMAETFYSPYVQKIWAIPPDRLSGELARRRVGARSSGDLVRKVVRRRRGDPDAGCFYYPRHGYGEIVERLADAAVDAGAQVRLDTEVLGVDDGADGASVRTAAEVLGAGVVLSTVPMTALPRLVTPAAPETARAAAATLDFRALTLVYVVLDRSRYTEFDAHYFPALDVPFSRVSEPKNYRDGAGSDPKDRTVLCAEVPCSVGDDVWRAPAGDLGDLVCSHLAAQGLPRVAPIAAEVRRVPNAYPVYRVGFEEDFRALDEWAGGLGRVVTLGRQGLFAHDNTHHALAMGRAAADAVRDGQFETSSWSAARAVFRSHVVED